MKERPILFSGPMVRAILEGRKTQTRRIVKPQPIEHDGVIECGPAIAGSMHALHQWLIANKCPYGKPGDRLWLREAISRFAMGNVVAYKADHDGANDIKWRPSIHMPRWASRITLDVVDVRVERLQDISEEDAKAEGCEEITPRFYRNYLSTDGATFYSAAMSFQSLWESINGPDSWYTNPWVWVVTFKKIN